MKINNINECVIKIKKPSAMSDYFNKNNKKSINFRLLIRHDYSQQYLTKNLLSKLYCRQYPLTVRTIRNEYNFVYATTSRPVRYYLNSIQYLE